MNIKAKMKCYEVKSSEWGEYVRLEAVYSEDPSSENYTFSEATPTATLTMTITNPQARGAFKQGSEYYLDFTGPPE